MNYASEKELQSATEDCEFNALEALNFADVVDLPQDRITLPVMCVYKYKLTSQDFVYIMQRSFSSERS